MPGSRKTPEVASMRETARRVLEIEAKAIADLASRLDGAFERAAELLLECQGRVVVTGMGKSGIVAQKIAATLSSTGTPSFFMHPAEALHGDLGMLVRGDVVIALSNSGETEEIVRLLELIRRLGAAIVGMSGDPGSTLARFADVHLHVGVDREACPLDLVPTASTTAALALGDALAVAVYARRGFSAQYVARVQVGQIMHSGEGVPRVHSGASMAEAVAEMSDKRLGMACVVDPEGRLVGVLTDGDLRRRMLRVVRPLEGRVDEAMSPSPVTIGASALAAEALRAMEERRITSLPGVDEAGVLLGVIQIHDLWRTELF